MSWQQNEVQHTIPITLWTENVSAGVQIFDKRLYITFRQVFFMITILSFLSQFSDFLDTFPNVCFQIYSDVGNLRLQFDTNVVRDAVNFFILLILVRFYQLLCAYELRKLGLLLCWKFFWLSERLLQFCQFLCRKFSFSFRSFSYIFFLLSSKTVNAVSRTFSIFTQSRSWYIPSYYF